jgi:hypothetical protein
MWLDGIAMVSGYSYDLGLYSAAQENVGEKRFPVLALHGLEDTVVNPLGCCASTTPDCCCEWVGDMHFVWVHVYL